MPVAAFSVFLLMGINAAAEGEKPSPKFSQDKKDKYEDAEKVIAVLKVAGIYSDTVKDVAYFVDERVEGKYFNVASYNYHGIDMSFRYDLGGIDKENIELNFRPEESNYELNMNPERVVLRYQIKF